MPKGGNGEGSIYRRGDGRWAAALVVGRDSKGRLIFSKPKTAGSRRTVDLAASTVTSLRERLAEQVGARTAALDAWAESGLVFTTALGTPVHLRNFARTMTRLASAAGVPDIGPHGLRHTFASLSLSRGVPVEVVSKVLGHYSPGFTLNVYRSVYPEERRAAAIDLDQIARSAVRARAQA